MEFKWKVNNILSGKYYKKSSFYVYVEKKVPIVFYSVSITVVLVKMILFTALQSSMFTYMYQCFIIQQQ